MASEGSSDSQVELFNLEGYRGVKRSRVVKYMATLCYPPILKEKREGMLFAGSFDSLQSAALAHDLAAYHLHGLKAVYNFPEVMSYAVKLSKTDRTVGKRGKRKVGNVSSMELDPIFGKMKLEDDTDALENKKMKLAGDRTQAPSLGVERKFDGIMEMDFGKFAVTMGSYPMLGMGIYTSPETAAVAYDIAAYFLHGSKTIFNFGGMIENVKDLPADILKAERAKAKAAKGTATSDQN
ncbi:putative transcription factor AP2-EREBP family [Helianthus annuus]|nr:putative transcription factor AP2-EREBP family [Helianthus annuus]